MTRATIGEVIRVGEFRALWIAHAQSRLGDQLARVAMTVLVFDRTSSAALTALTYALTLLPPLITAPLLSGLADRYPRRTVLVVTQLISAVLVAVMAVPGMPVVARGILLVGVVSLQPLYSAARNAMLPNVLDGERYMVGIGLVTSTDGVMLVTGFATGGALVALLGPSGALGLDALTFVLGALLVGLGTRPHRPSAPDPGEEGPRSAWASMSRGFGLIWSDLRLRYLLAVVYGFGFYIAPEGLAVPYADELGAGVVAVGLLMAAEPVGMSIGALLLSRWVPPGWREPLLGRLAIAAGVPLVLSALFPSLAAALVLWAVMGVLSSYTTIGQGLFVRMVPDNRRGQAIGLASAGLQTAQGAGVVMGGLLADLSSPSAAVGMMGAAGILVALPAARAWDRARTAVPL